MQLVQVALLDHKAQQDHRVPPDLVLQVQLAHKDHKGQPEPQAHKDHKDHKVQQVPQEQVA